MMSAADMEELGWPEPAAVVQRMLSMRSCAARSAKVSAIVSLRVGGTKGVPPLLC
ncbi:hypothetical protein KH5H1_27340 [Corallococcus caeni]|nr:hypothetical protein KH5H1_27340 [Corallococcus sp. KH5-1]